jgi:hypothetical protein
MPIEEHEAKPVPGDELDAGGGDRLDAGGGRGEGGGGDGGGLDTLGELAGVPQMTPAPVYELQTSSVYVTPPTVEPPVNHIPLLLEQLLLVVMPIEAHDADIAGCTSAASTSKQHVSGSRSPMVACPPTARL